MKYTLRDLLHAINVLNEDRDVYVSSIDGIAVCPPVKLTPEGEKYFAVALNAEVYEGQVEDDSEEVEEEAWTLLCALAGNCSASNTEKWFEGETAKEI